MIPLLEAYYERLHALHAGVARALDDLPEKALDWNPGPGMNSVAVLVTHLAGAERYWIGDVAGGDPSGRVRETEFEVRGGETSALLGLLDRTLEHSRRTLGNLKEADLSASRVASRDGQAFTVAWCLYHAMQHTALHLGHIEITRQMWQQHVGEAGAPDR